LTRDQLCLKYRREGNALNKNKFDSLSKDLLDKRGTIISSEIIKQIQFK